MSASHATISPTGRPEISPTPGSPIPDGLLPWAAFHLLCLWTRSTPDAVARMIGADGFDAGFGLGDGGR